MNLGAFWEEYRSKNRLQHGIAVGLLLIGVPGILFALFSFGIGEKFVGVIALALTSGMVVTGVRLIRGNIVELYQGGVTVARRQEKITLPWDEIKAIYFEKVREMEGFTPSVRDRVTTDLRLIRKDGVEVRITEPGASQIFRQAVEATLTRLLEETRRDLSERGKGDFGPVAISRQCLIYQPPLSSPSTRKTEAWSPLMAAGFQDGTLCINLGNEQLEYQTSEIPNLEVFLRVLQEDYSVTPI